MKEHTFNIYRNGDPENVVVRLFCTLELALKINYNLENSCAYGHSYQIRQID